MCPICGRDASPRSNNAAFPFCSAKCKLVDLGRWLDGSYRIPGPPVTSTEDPYADELETGRRADSEEDG
jgi:endogenous inhibitor of DNA gyrase (YacG/DUF329 family)